MCSIHYIYAGLNSLPLKDFSWLSNALKSCQQKEHEDGERRLSQRRTANGNQNSLTTTAIKKLLRSYAHTETQANQKRKRTYLKHHAHRKDMDISVTYSRGVRLNFKPNSWQQNLDLQLVLCFSYMHIYVNANTVVTTAHFCWCQCTQNHRQNVEQSRMRQTSRKEASNY